MDMKRIATCLVFVVAFLLLSSCEKEYISPAQSVADELNSLIAKEWVVKVAVVDASISLNRMYLTYSRDFEVKGEFVRVGTNYYHLSQLVKYEILHSQEPLGEECWVRLYIKMQ